MTTAPPPTVDPPGMTWPALFALRDRLAHYWYRRQGCNYPLEEYQSAGNLAITYAVRQYDATRGTSFPHFAANLCYREMCVVPRAESGIGNPTRGRPQPKYKTELRSPGWWHYHQEVTEDTAPALGDLADVTRWLATYPRTTMVAALLLAVEGYTEDEIAQTTQQTPCAINKGISSLRQAYRGWEADTHQDRASYDAQQAARRVERAEQAKVLQAQGHTTTAIAKAIGATRGTVRKLLAMA